jgi:hypothetical protein
LESNNSDDINAGGSKGLLLLKYNLSMPGRVARQST